MDLDTWVEWLIDTMLDGGIPEVDATKNGPEHILGVKVLSPSGAVQYFQIRIEEGDF